MSTFTQPTDTQAHDHHRTPAGASEAHSRVGRWASLLIALVVLGWSTIELISLGLRHTTGAEVYGVLVAAVSVGAGVLSLVLLASPRRRRLAGAAVLILWAVVAIGGIAGTIAHMVGPVPGHGPADLRPRPVAAPLIFTAFGLVGGAAVVYGQRAGMRGARSHGQE